MRAFRVFQVISFLVFFQINMRVKAGVSFRDQSYKTSPENCLKEETSCAIEVGRDVLRYSNQGVAVHLSPRSFVLREEGRRWTWIKGTIWVEKGNVEVATAMANLKSKKGGLWVFQDEKEDKIWVRASHSDVEVEMKSGKKLTLPEGFQVWIGKIDGQLTTAFGMPEVIPWEDYVLKWGPLYPGTASDFKKDLFKLRKEWADLSDRGGALYEGVIQRQIAIEKDSAEAEKVRIKNEEKERQRLRALFKKKVLDQ